MTKTEKLEKYAQDTLELRGARVEWGRAPSCCADPFNGGAIPYGYTLYPNTGWQKDIEFIGVNYEDAMLSLERMSF